MKFTSLALTLMTLIGLLTAAAPAQAQETEHNRFSIELLGGGMASLYPNNIPGVSPTPTWTGVLRLGYTLSPSWEIGLQGGFFHTWDGLSRAPETRYHIVADGRLFMSKQLQTWQPYFLFSAGISGPGNGGSIAPYLGAGAGTLFRLNQNFALDGQIEFNLHTLVMPRLGAHFSF